MIKFQTILLSYLLLSSAFTQQTYFGDYGGSKRTCPCKKMALSNPKVNWDKNFILNGNFESPSLPNG